MRIHQNQTGPCRKGPGRRQRHLGTQEPWRLTKKVTPPRNQTPHMMAEGRRRVRLMSPQGRPLQQSDLRRWASGYDQLVLICGHYEGFDERIRSLADEEVSIGDFVLTGGELPAAVIINGVVRLLPGTVGTQACLEEESHSALLLEHPHYTRPASFRELEVPAVLRSGDHGAIARWRFEQQQQRTAERRPDLFARWQAQQQVQQ